MSNHIWNPTDADDDGLMFQITYRNECGEEYARAKFIVDFGQTMQSDTPLSN